MPGSVNVKSFLLRLLICSIMVCVSAEDSVQTGTAKQMTISSTTPLMTIPTGSGASIFTPITLLVLSLLPVFLQRALS